MALDINKIQNKHLLDVDQQRSLYEASLLVNPPITPSIEKQVESPYKKDTITSGDPTGLALKLKVAAYDTVNFAKFSSTPKGILFHLSQMGLQISNPISENIDTQIYNPIKLAANMATAPFGFRFRRDGALVARNYEQIDRTGGKNRLVSLYNTFQTAKTATAGAKKSKLGKFVSKAAKKLGVNLMPGKLIPMQSGLGGPNSLYGLGFTKVFTNAPGNPVEWVNSYDFESKYKKRDITIKYDGGGSLTVTDVNDSEYKTTYLINALALGYPSASNTPNRFKYFDEYIDGQLKYFSNYETDVLQNKHIKYKIPNTSKNILSNDHIDPIYNDVLIDEELTPDFIKLAFNNVLDGNKWLQFRATIQGLSIKINPEWEGINYVGRPEKFHLYKGFNRTIDFNFITVALSGDLINMYKKLDYLQGCCMPRGASRMQAPIMKLKIGNLLFANGKNSVAGIITSLTYDIDDSYIWDLDAELPMYMKVNISYEILETDANILAGSYLNKQLTNIKNIKAQELKKLKPASEREYSDPLRLNSI